MVLAANFVISHKRILTFLSSKPGNAGIIHHHCQFKPNLHSCSQSPPISRIVTTFCLANTAPSYVKVHSPDPGSVDAASNSWSEFARNVSGEWDGYGADFTSEGITIKLPESVVPEAYREWEVKV